jgi:phage terminase small subunit
MSRNQEWNKSVRRAALMRLVDKLPTLDPTWSIQQVDQWCRCFNIMMKEADAIDMGGEVIKKATEGKPTPNPAPD